MNNKEKNEFKKEIISEILQKLKGGKFDFSEYKSKVNKTDLSTIKSFADEKHGYYYLPIIGYLIYLKKFSIAYASIDRGVVRSEMVKIAWSWKFLLTAMIPMIMGISFIINYIPLIHNRTYKKLENAVKNNA